MPYRSIGPFRRVGLASWRMLGDARKVRVDTSRWFRYGDVSLSTRMSMVAMCATFMVLAACLFLFASRQAEGPTLGNIYASEPSSPVGDPTSEELFPFLTEFPGDGRIYGVMTQTGESAELDAFTAAAGKAPNLVGVNVDWTTPYDPWHTERLAERGAMPMISWEPWDANQISTVDQQRSEQPDYAVDEILSGRYDDYIDEWAADLAEWEHPVMLRFAHEMNGGIRGPITGTGTPLAVMSSCGVTSTTGLIRSAPTT